MNVASMSPEIVVTSSTSIPSWFVVAMGMGIVVVGLICIVLLCSLMSKVVKLLEGNTVPAAPQAASVPAAAPAVPAAEPIANRQELVAAISAALAEELGTDVSGIRIISLKKV